MCDRCELNYILNNFMTKFVNKHQFGRIHTSKSASAFCKKFAETMCIHDRCKIFCNFFPNIQTDSLNSVIICRHQKSNLQICKFLTSTAVLSKLMSTHRQILTFYFFLLLLELYQLYNHKYEHWRENSALKTSDNIELVTHK